MLESGGILYELKDWDQEIWKMALPNGKWEKTRLKLPKVGDFSTGGISYDGKEFVYADSHSASTSKLMVIDNLFK